MYLLQSHFLEWFQEVASVARNAQSDYLLINTELNEQVWKFIGSAMLNLLDMVYLLP